MSDGDSVAKDAACVSRWASHDELQGMLQRFMTDEQTTGWSKNTDSTLDPVSSAESSTAPSRSPAGRKRRSWVWIVVAILIILAVAGIRLFQNRSQPQSARLRPASAPPPLMIATTAAQK